MAAKKTTTGSITQTADVQTDRINNISNVSSAINRMQKDVDQKIAETQKEVGDAKSISQVHNSMNQTLGGLNQTIAALTRGIGQITADTARATADTIRQYGQAISQDISFNKKSVVSMALAQTSPLYGYFVAKFMETDVFKKALTRMKVAISSTIGAIVRPLKGRGAARGGADIPHMQTGGKVQQGGMARLHAGETVVPGGMDLTGVDNTLKELLQVQKRQALYMRSVFGVWAEVGLGKRVLKKIISPFTIPFKILKMFRKTKGRYAGHLSKSGQPMQNMAQNIATLYMGLMWRLDNMLNVMVANTEATRDLSAFVTKTKYKPIPSVSSRVPAFSMLRAIGKMALRPITGPLEFLSKGMFGDTALTKKRGLYKKEPGFVSSMLDRLRPESRREMLGERGRRGKIARGGQFGGPGILGEENQVMNMTGHKFATVLARVQSDEFGGSRGFKHPIWTIRKFGREDSFRHMEQQEKLEAIQESNSRQADLQEDAKKRAKKQGMMGRIMGWLKLGMGFLGSIFKVAAMGLVAGAIGVMIGTAVKKWLDSKFDFSNKVQDFLFFNEKTAVGINALVSKEAGTAGKFMRKLGTADISAQAAHVQVQRMKRSQAVKKTTGALEGRGAIYVDEIQSGMQQYIQSNMPSYLNYDPKKVARLRQQWLNSPESGGWLSRQWEKVKTATNAVEVGKELERKFHGYMMKNLTELSPEQRAVPKAYEEKWLAGAKAKGMTPDEISALRKTQAAQDVRMRRTVKPGTGAQTLAGADPAKIRESVKNKFLDQISSVMSKERGYANSNALRGKAMSIYDAITESAPLALLSDYDSLWRMGKGYLDAQKGATTWYGGYSPSKVREYVDAQIKNYNKGLPQGVGSADRLRVKHMEGGIAGAAIATQQATIIVSEMKVGSMPILDALEEVGDQITNATGAVGGAVVSTMNSNSQITNTNIQNSNVTGGGGAAQIPDHTVIANQQGRDLH